MKILSTLDEIRASRGGNEREWTLLEWRLESEKSIGPHRAYSERCHAQLTTLENGNSRFHEISWRSETAREQGKVRGRERNTGQLVVVLH